MLAVVFFRPNVEKLLAKRNTIRLISLLKHKDNEIRCEAALALGELKCREAIRPLIESLVNQSSEGKLTIDFVKALSNMGEIAIEPLGELFLKHVDKNKDFSLWLDVLKILSKIGGEAIEPIRYYVRKQLKKGFVSDILIESLSKFNNAAVDDLCYIYRQATSYIEKKQILHYLSRIQKECDDERIWNIFLDALHDKNKEVKEEAISCIGISRKPEAITIFRECIFNNGYEIISNVIRQLKNYGPASFPVLQEIIISRQLNYGFRMQALEVIDKQRDVAKECLIDIFHSIKDDDKPELQYELCYILSKLGWKPENAIDAVKFFCWKRDK